MALTEKDFEEFENNVGAVWEGELACSRLVQYKLQTLLKWRLCSLGGQLWWTCM